MFKGSGKCHLLPNWDVPVQSCPSLGAGDGRAGRGGAVRHAAEAGPCSQYSGLWLIKNDTVKRSETLILWGMKCYLHTAAFNEGDH